MLTKTTKELDSTTKVTLYNNGYTLFTVEGDHRLAVQPMLDNWVIVCREADAQRVEKIMMVAEIVHNAIPHIPYDAVVLCLLDAVQNFTQKSVGAESDGTKFVH